MNFLRNRFKQKSIHLENKRSNIKRNECCKANVANKCTRSFISHTHLDLDSLDLRNAEKKIRDPNAGQTLRFDNNSHHWSNNNNIQKDLLRATRMHWGTYSRLESAYTHTHTDRASQWAPSFTRAKLVKSRHQTMPYINAIVDAQI